MKFSFYCGFTRALTERGAAGSVAYARELGFSAVEALPCGALSTEAQARELKTALDNEGLVMSCFSIGINLFGENAQQSEEKLYHIVDLAHILGAPYVHHTLAAGISTRKFGTPGFDEIFDEVVERAGRVSDYAAQAGIRTIYEDQGYFFNGADNFDRFLTALNRENTGVCADFGNSFYVGENPEHFIGRNTHRIYNVHFKDYLRKSGNEPDPGEGWHQSRDGDFLRETVVGHGIVNIVSCLRLLVQSGYDGYYASEFSGPEPFEWGTKCGLKNMEYYMELAQHRSK